jgi:uncharacterized membrane protein YciS (DUF1049 family)
MKQIIIFVSMLVITVVLAVSCGETDGEAVGSNVVITGSGS